jgi:integrase
MSVYRKPRSPYWHYDFWCRGHRFLGSTKCTSHREAEAVEHTEREKAKRRIGQLQAAKTSLRLDDVADRYWLEVGQHHAGADNTARQLGYLIECPHLGPNILLTDITGDHVARLIAWGRGRRTRGGALISAFTVNDTTEQLKKLFTRAKAWGVRFEHEPEWRKFWLAEPQERVRELMDDEAERLEAAMRDDLAPFFAFAHASGLRLRECLLRWSEVHWGPGQIRKLGKGGRIVTIPITSAIREILWPLQGHHPIHVFTYVAQRTRDGRVKGERHPLTYSGIKIAWRRLRKRAQVVGFRFHDYRHDFGTKLLRETGNLKLVQRALNHADLKTTARYAHVLDSDVAEAMERVAKSRTKSRTIARKVG